MSTIQLRVEGHYLSLVNAGILSSGSENVDYISVTFDSAWDEYTKTAVFIPSVGERIPVATLIDESGTSQIPNSILKNNGVFLVGILGNKDGSQMTTTLYTHNLNRGTSTNGVVDVEPDPTIYQQILSAYAEVSTELKNKTEIADSSISDLVNAVSNINGELDIIDENLLNIDKDSSVNLVNSILESTTLNGITITKTINNGLISYDFNGTSTAQVSAYIELEFSLTDAEKLYGCPKGGSATTFMLCAQSTDNIFYKDYGDGVNLPSGSYSNMGIIIRSGQTLDHKIFTPYIGKKTNLNTLKNKKWVALGDSLTEKNWTAQKNYTDLISEELGIKCVNMGVSGTGYWKKHNISKCFMDRSLNVPSDADIVTIFGSGNDMKNDAGEIPTDNMIGTASDTGTDTWCGYVNSTIDNVLSVNPCVRLGIISPTPWCGTNPNFNNTMRKMSDKLGEICKRRGIPFLNLYYESNLRPWDSSQNSCFAEADITTNTHPNDKGNLIYYGRIREFIKGL